MHVVLTVTSDLTKKSFMAPEEWWMSHSENKWEGEQLLKEARTSNTEGEKSERERERLINDLMNRA